MAHRRLVQICCNDFDQEIAMVVENTQNREIIGVARLSRQPLKTNADLKMIIKDAWHGKGLGALLLKTLITIAKSEKIDTICATILSENSGMLHILQKSGFSLSQKADTPYTYASIML